MEFKFKYYKTPIGLLKITGNSHGISSIIFIEDINKLEQFKNIKSPFDPQVFEEVANKDLICNRTAVKSVLSSVYSAEKRKNKDCEERFKVENLSVSQQTTLLNLEEEEVPEQCLAA